MSQSQGRKNKGYEAHGKRMEGMAEVQSLKEASIQGVF
jgi:hypothetical protein